MQMVGEQRIAAPRQRVWEALNDPEILRASIPGCQSLEKDGDNRFVAVAEVKIGPIGARFKGAVELTDIQPANGYTIVGKGDGGIAGNAKGQARVRLSDDGGGTLVSYEVEADVGGRMAQLGGPIIDATAKQLAGKFFSRFGEIVSGQASPTTAVLKPGAASSTSTAVGAAQWSGFPWPWVAALVVAIVAGFLLGRSDAADAWVLGVALLAVVAVGAGFDAGRRNGARP